MSALVPDIAWLESHGTWQPNQHPAWTVFAAPGHPLRWHLADRRGQECLRLEVGDVDYGVPPAHTRPRVAEAYVEGDALVAALTLATPLGLQVVVALRLREGGMLDVEFRMTTVEDVASAHCRLSVAGDRDTEFQPAAAAVSDGSLRDPGEVVWRPAHPTQVVLSRPGASSPMPAVAFFADLGAEGQCLVPADRRSVEYRLFGRALEKGVILINRVALWPTDAAPATGALAPAALEASYVRWLKRTSYL